VDIDVLMLNLDALFTTAVSLQRLKLCSEHPRELVERDRRAVMLWDVFSLRQAPCGGHRGVVHGRHLSSEHCLDVVARLHDFRVVMRKRLEKVS
jgi:hypothetical protein